MLLPRLQPPLRAALGSIARSSASGNSTTCLNEAFAALAIRSSGMGQVRHASHAQQGAVNKAKDGPGKRLGAKKSGEQYVIPGNIIFRQRGTHWFPGENCAMGRDHTIYATESGYVKYYKDPLKHPDRQYIGVVFERDWKLPTPRNAPRRRRLNMTAVKMETPPETRAAATTLQTNIVVNGDGKLGVVIKAKKNKDRKGEEGRDLKLRPGYMYREANWEIGRAAERAKVQVREFKPRDRWTAWSKRTARAAKSAEKRSLGRKLK